MEAADAVAWPFAVGGQISERLEWLTDGLRPPYGMEQTRKLRQAPRTVLLFDGLESGRNRRWMENLLAKNGAGLWHGPLVADTTTTTSAATLGATTLAVDTDLRRFRAGGNALLVDRSDPRRYEVVEIETVLADSLELAEAMVAAWPAGSLIIPTVGVRLVDAPQISRFTGDSAPYSVSFRVDEPLDWVADFGAAEYRDLPVFEMPIDWSSDPVYTHSRDIEPLDNGTGRVLLYDRAGILLPRIAMELALFSAEAIGVFRSLLYALSGRWQPIWVPSYGQDLRLQAVASTTTIDVEWTGFSEWPLQANRKDIRIERRSGSPVYRRVTAAAEVDIDTERLQLDAALPDGFDAADVVGISFMALCRQESDVNLLRVWSPGVMESQLTFVGCNHGL